MLRKWHIGAADERRQPAPAEILTSRLLPLLLEAAQDRERINVLDLGSGSQSTVDFFAGYNARIHFVDLYSCALVTDPPEQLDTATASALIEEYLHLPDGLAFDVCLFWDVLHHLSRTALEGLSRALGPFLGRRTLGYGFGSLHSGARAAERSGSDQGLHYRYGIEDGSHLRLRPVELTGRYHAHTQQQLDEYFPAMAIQKATLLREGRLELLFSRD